MNFAVPRAIITYPQLEINYSVEWKCLNHAFGYDAILMLIVCNIITINKGTVL